MVYNPTDLMPSRRLVVKDTCMYMDRVSIGIGCIVSRRSLSPAIVTIREIQGLD